MACDDTAASSSLTTPVMPRHYNSARLPGSRATRSIGRDASRRRGCLTGVTGADGPAALSEVQRHKLVARQQRQAAYTR